ncbi:hypothetical protein FA743_10985 [Paracoccus gahaiensis]|uniref:Uncharacterized protein n=1 Tax=Paracoccus gahaiensis TaxID=1706839 RepID=A0A4U0R8X7_9RHOB|nr:hypothetical protein FA743_10985 [Paracoccus gahaiensis]
MIEGFCQGGPLPAFGGVMATARDWASWATRAELKAYCFATFEAMNAQDQAAFRELLKRRAAS